MSSKKNSKKTSQVKKVTRKFLNDLADKIYNTKSRKFLRLCNGTLQNGPDPTDEKRSMHCGLGELYFEMTGKQPRTAGVNEDGVIYLAILNSGLEEAKQKKIKKVVGQVKTLDLPASLKNELILNIEDDPAFDDVQEQFEEALNDIPNRNDDDRDDGTYECYRSRASRVAAQLRKAAKLLPE